MLVHLAWQQNKDLAVWQNYTQALLGTHYLSFCPLLIFMYLSIFFTNLFFVLHDARSEQWIKKRNFPVCTLWRNHSMKEGKCNAIYTNLLGHCFAWFGSPADQTTYFPLNNGRELFQSADAAHTLTQWIVCDTVLTNSTTTIRRAAFFSQMSRAFFFRSLHLSSTSSRDVILSYKYNLYWQI